MDSSAVAWLEVNRCPICGELPAWSHSEIYKSIEFTCPNGHFYTDQMGKLERKMASDPVETAMASMYHQIKRRPIDGSLSAAIRIHAQACGVVAYIFDVHPDRVAQAIVGTESEWVPQEC